jgi:peptidoglycan/xylan/chitin deacetylase (PgdA/CDA1 family)
VATPASPAEVAARATVPSLCWHQLRDWTAKDGAYSRNSLICPPAHFRAQLDAIAADGWTTIGPDAYLDHLLTGAALPPKPVLLTFDDSQGSQMTEALPQLQARGMTATFFVMTVVLDKPGWMSRADVASLHGAGMTVAAHTWDHHRADRYGAADWQVQLDQPRALLEQVVGAPVVHFAYPYGAWAPEDFAPLTSAGYRTAFQLADKPLDAGTPLYTLRRDLVTSTWDGPGVLAALGRGPG